MTGEIEREMERGWALHPGEGSRRWVGGGYIPKLNGRTRMNKQPSWGEIRGKGKLQRPRLKARKLRQGMSAMHVESFVG